MSRASAEAELRSGNYAGRTAAIVELDTLDREARLARMGGGVQKQQRLAQLTRQAALLGNLRRGGVQKQERFAQLSQQQRLAQLTRQAALLGNLRRDGVIDRGFWREVFSTSREQVSAAHRARMQAVVRAALGYDAILPLNILPHQFFQLSIPIALLAGLELDGAHEPELRFRLATGTFVRSPETGRQDPLAYVVDRDRGLNRDVWIPWHPVLSLSRWGPVAKLRPPNKRG